MERNWTVLEERIKAIKELRKHLGEKIQITVSIPESTITPLIDGRLNWIEPCNFLLIDELKVVETSQKMGAKVRSRVGKKSGTVIYFISVSSAIQKIISLETGEVLFFNPYVFVPYQINQNVSHPQSKDIDPVLKVFMESSIYDEVDSLVAITFGWKVAHRLRKERKGAKNKILRKIQRGNTIAFRQGITLIEEGEKYVRPELREKWRKVCTELIYKGALRGFYSYDVVWCAVRIMEKLSQGEPVEIAENELQKGGIAGLSVCQALDVINLVSEFHSRGEEIKKWWTKR